MNRAPRAFAKDHAWQKAKALGAASATTNQFNPYKPGTQCWMLFDIERRKALNPTASRSRQGANDSPH